LPLLSTLLSHPRPIFIPDLPQTPLLAPLLPPHFRINSHQILKSPRPALKSDANFSENSPTKLLDTNVLESSAVSLTLSAIYALYDKSSNQNLNPSLFLNSLHKVFMILKDVVASPLQNISLAWRCCSNAGQQLPIK
jgi:hypothetical protein